jgi:hypothetical protein
MKPNESNADRVVRLVVASIMLVVAISTAGTVSLVAWVLAGLMLLTALVGVCPLYALLRTGTLKSSRQS